MQAADRLNYSKCVDLIRLRKLDIACPLLLDLHRRYPENCDVHFALEHARMGVCDWNGWQKRRTSLVKTITELVNGERAIGTFPLCYIPLALSSEVFAALAKKQTVSSVSPLLAPLQNATKMPTEKTGSKIRLAYISIDFRSHSAGLSLAPLIRAHNREQFEVFGYSLSDSPPAQVFDRLIDARGMTAEQIADQVRADNIQILIETTRHILDSVSAVVSFRPAPLIISAWGYGGTSGYETVDYILTDAIIAPDDEESLSEKRLDINQYHPIASLDQPVKSTTRKELDWPDNAFLFGSFNTSYKIQPELFDIWMHVLKKVSNSHLVLLLECEQAQVNLKAEAKIRGVSPDRLVFVRRTSHAAHLSRLTQINLILDNPYFGGGSSIVDGIHAGTPGITLQNGNMQTNSGKSIYHAVGLEQLVAQNLDAYSTLAIEIANSNARIDMAIAQTRLRDNWQTYAKHFDQVLSATFNRIKN